MTWSGVLFPEPAGQGWLQVAELSLAFILSSLIGLEREIRMKSAGLRTHTLVGLGGALIVIVSKYGFADVLTGPNVRFDPSRVAAQIVSGVGFIGGGLISVRGDAVRGLTTAAVVWLTAAIGMACGAGLPILALFANAAHFVVVYGYTPINRRVLDRHYRLKLHYRPRKDVMHHVFKRRAEQRFQVEEVSMPDRGDADIAQATIDIAGRQRTEQLIVALGEIEGVDSVNIRELEE